MIKYKNFFLIKVIYFKKILIKRVVKKLTFDNKFLIKK